MSAAERGKGLARSIERLEEEQDTNIVLRLLCFYYRCDELVCLENEISYMSMHVLREL